MKNNRNKPPRKCTKESQKKAIRRGYAIRAAKERAGQTTADNSRLNDQGQQAAETYPHFRHYLKSNHPALIVGELEPDEYKYHKVTHSEREGRHLNQKVYPNPDPKDSNPMYIVKRQRHDKKKHFGKRLPWKPPKK